MFVNCMRFLEEFCCHLLFPINIVFRYVRTFLVGKIRWQQNYHRILEEEFQLT